MPSPTDSALKSAGIKRYLRRTRSIEELKIMADSCFGKAAEEVVIINTAAEGGSAGGEVSMPAGILLLAIEDVLQELGVVPTDSNGMIISRQLCTKADWGRTIAVL